MSALLRLGYRVPGDGSLIGYNDIPLVSRLPTHPTSVHVASDQTAAAALGLLGSDEVAVKNRIRTLTPSLIPRKSTAAPAAEIRPRPSGPRA